MKLEIDNQQVSLSVLRKVWQAPVTVRIGDHARRAIERAQAQVDKVIAGGKTVYGVNTGFGQLAKIRISDDELSHLQENLIRSHAVGVGAPLADDVVRLIMVLKVIGLARGYSGIRPVLMDALCALINHDICPVIPSKGSVGASGDLAPLAHMAGVLMGFGNARCDGRLMPALEALAIAGLEPIQLAPKEGLALLNGTQVSTALTVAALFKAENLLSASLVAGAMSADAIKGSDTPFDEKIHQVRGHAGQIDVAKRLRGLMKGSEIRASHVDCKRVQDPYSIRCQPQVIGACLGVLRHAADLLLIESNAVTDNPLVFADADTILSGGNFHAEPVALVADYMALAISEIGSLSERRMALLIDSHLSELPAFLVKDSGLNSGFMMAQVTAAALASENKTLAHPASIDSLPTSANQEDHVSMATFAGRRLHDILDNVACIVSIELLGAAQGVEFHRPQTSSPPLEEAIALVRTVSPRYETDRSLSTDIEAIAAFIIDGRFAHFADSLFPSEES